MRVLYASASAGLRTVGLELLLGLRASSSATFVSCTTTSWRAVASASGPACSAIAFALFACAIASAWRISDWLRAAAFSASASCSRSVASRSASACAMRASLATRAASGAPRFAM